MSISSIYILDKKGNIIINRHYTSEVDPNTVEKFQRKLVALDDTNFTPYLIDEENDMVYSFYNFANLVCKIISLDYLVEKR